MELCPQTSINTGFLNAVPTFIHNHFTFLFALEEESINEFFTTKKTLEKEEDNALFSKVYIFSRTNYNLLSAKTCSAITLSVTRTLPGHIIKYQQPPIISGF
jgi:hypothetical protein